jgi:hypothetical protein
MWYILAHPVKGVGLFCAWYFVFLEQRKLNYVFIFSLCVLGCVCCKLVISQRLTTKTANLSTY